jgi:hypothetical protein
MKHVFYVHSHTLFLTAIGTINFLKLEPKKVIFFYTRNYTKKNINIPYKGIDLSEIFLDSMKAGEVFYFWKLNRLVKIIDILISKEVTEDYIAYLPHVGVFLPQVIATNKSCKGIRYVEEGMLSYSSSLAGKKRSVRELAKQIFSFLFTHYNRFWFTDKVFKHYFFTKKFLYTTQTFGVSLESFKALQFKKNIVKWPTIEKQYQIDPSIPIFILEAAIEQKFISKDIYLSAIEKIINFSKSEVNYVKFHPAQSEGNKNLIRQYFAEHNKNIIELSQDFPFEMLLLQYENLNIIGFGSSLLFYANNLGHTVTSFEYLLMKDILYVRYKKAVDFKI